MSVSHARSMIEYRQGNQFFCASVFLIKNGSDNMRVLPKVHGGKKTIKRTVMQTALKSMRLGGIYGLYGK